jgi:hypothetical protein
LRDKGRPNTRIYYSKVIKAQAIGSNAVRFDLGRRRRELPLILGLMPVLPKHAIDPETFEETTLKPMIGSGALCVWQGRPGPQCHAHSQSELLGARPRRQSRLLEFRRDPIRLLSRSQFPSRSLQARPVRRAQGVRSRALGAGL